MSSVGRLVTTALLIACSFLSHASEYDSSISPSEASQKLFQIKEQNPNARGLMELTNFVHQKRMQFDIYSMTAEEGREYVPQDEISIIAYNAYIKKGFHPLVAIQETIRIIVESTQIASPAS